MATLSERPSFWRVPRDFNYPPKQRPQSCIWSPPVSSHSYDSNSLPRNNRVSFCLPEDQVQLGSPAADAGLRSGDVLLEVNNTSTVSPPLSHGSASDLIRRSGNTMDVKVQRQPAKYSPVTVSPQSSPRTRYATEPSSSITPYRPLPINRGVIPTISTYDTSIRKPESNTEEYLREKAREQWAISKQTYRTLPLIEPRPKVHRDWPIGCYMRLMEGPSWHDSPKQAPPPKHLQEVINKYGQGVANNPQVVHLQYNSPANLYSDENVANALTPQSGSPRPTRAVPPPVVQIKSQLQKPLTVDITQSPTYQLLQEEEDYEPSRDRSSGHGHHTAGPGHSPSKFSPRGQHSPNYPIQTPYFRSLMNSLLPGV